MQAWRITCQRRAPRLRSQRPIPSLCNVNACGPWRMRQHAGGRAEDKLAWRRLEVLLARSIRVRTGCGAHSTMGHLWCRDRVLEMFVVPGAGCRVPGRGMVGLAATIKLPGPR